MQWMLTLVLVLQMLAALVMIGLVLIQHGKGADMGASFGSGASGSLFGATGSANFLSRTTAVCAAIFFACTLALAYFGNLRGPAGGGGSVLDRAAPVTAPASVAPSAPALGAIPGEAAPAASASPAASAAVEAASAASK
ncbi:MAG TPA: preprotein translocase subunit SecG [Burkholderiaceae bacterium]|jgi:preprotein translocase subunit SecG|nr:preprotein translocase subunit SecG [Burkholderiaceae bacterium]